MFDNEDGSCQCGGHAVVRVNKKNDSRFYGCSNYPVCKNTEPLHRNKPQGDFLISGDDILEAFYDAFYDGDGR